VSLEYLVPERTPGTISKDTGPNWLINQRKQSPHQQKEYSTYWVQTNSMNPQWSWKKERKMQSSFF
jgi:hypothetical protein